MLHGTQLYPSDNHIQVNMNAGNCNLQVHLLAKILQNTAWGTSAIEDVHLGRVVNVQRLPWLRLFGQRAHLLIVLAALIQISVKPLHWVLEVTQAEYSVSRVACSVSALLSLYGFFPLSLSGTLCSVFCNSKISCFWTCERWTGWTDSCSADSGKFSSDLLTVQQLFRCGL